MNGLFVCFEGIDGSGKSTAVNWFCEQLEKELVQVVRTREPGGTPLAEKIRELVLWGDQGESEDFPDWAEACLYNAARATHLENMVLPMLKEGRIVVSDRFCDSTFAHQGGGRGLSIDGLKQIHNIVCNGVIPHLTFVFDGDPEIFRKRMVSRNPDRLERMPIEFQHRSRQVHLDLAAADPGRYAIIDATQPLEDVQAQLRGHLLMLVNRHRERPAT